MSNPKRIIDLLNEETKNKTVVVASGYKFDVYDIINDTIFGCVYFKDHPLPIQWKANGFPVDTKEVPENYHLRLIEKKQ